MRNSCCLLLLLVMGIVPLHAQRSYKNASILAAGNWYKIGVKESGIYKVDLALLSKLGVSTAGIATSAIRVFGNGGAMLPEACSGLKIDDLEENAIQVVDGGDGVLNGNDYFLFYATGPDTWLKDSVNQRFKHQKNLYSQQAFYFISIGGTGKRIQNQTLIPPPNTAVTAFSDRYVHELDSVNFLSSSKDWYGEEFSSLPGRSSNQVFPVPLANINTGQPATLVSACVARSLGGSSRFTTAVNALPVMQQDIGAVGNTSLDLFAKT